VKPDYDVEGKPAINAEVAIWNLRRTVSGIPATAATTAEEQENRQDGVLAQWADRAASGQCD
jgi:hypothetical protein